MANMILFNGVSGGLGRYFAAAASALGLDAFALKARLEDRDSTREELRRALATRPSDRPVTLVHMAAIVSVPACEKDPSAAEQTNVTDTVALVRDFLDALRVAGREARVLYVSSGHVYAAQPPGVRINEEADLAPRSVYARTKLSAERALAKVALADNAPLIVARVFGLLAPGQPANYVLPAMIRRVRQRDLHNVPGVSCVRDYLDARDVCRLLARLCKLPPRTEIVNVCSGVGVTIREVLEEIMRTIAPAEASALAAELTEAPARPDDVPSIVGDPSRLTALLGEAPRQIPLARTVADAVEGA
jgi:GDP-4-dehydro-6-deoxy-D-mannose reductase